MIIIPAFQAGDVGLIPTTRSRKIPFQSTWQCLEKEFFVHIYGKKDAFDKLFEYTK